MNRREFLARTGAGIGAIGLGTTDLGAASAATLQKRPIYIFSKHLAFLDYEELAETAAEMGFDGIDLTVRPGGHVPPERVREDLPRAVRIIRESGLAADIISTGITDASSQSHEMLAIARDSGIQQYRVWMSRYHLDEPIETQFNTWKESIEALARLNESVGILGAIQNHSRFFLGGFLWDLWEAIKETPPAAIACHYDPCHAVAEAAISWPVGFHLLKSRITAIIIKDFDFTQSEKGLNRRWTPLGKGKVPWERFWPMLQESNLQVPLILHMEYGNKQDHEEIKAFLRQDLQTLRSMLAGTWQRS